MFENLKQVLTAYGESIVQSYQNGLLDEDAFASGGLLENTRSYIIEHQDGVYEVELNLPFYWKYVEEGNQPAGKYPNINANGKGWGAYYPILEWIRIKPIVPHPDSRGKVPTNEQLAGMYVHSMIENGTEGRHILEKAIDENTDWLGLIDEAVEMDIRKDIDEIMGLL